MRSTKASAALERLKRRSGNQDYSMARSADGLFHLLEYGEDGEAKRLSPSMEQDDFVAYLNGLGPQPEPKRVSKHDLALEKQIRHSKEKG
jgi:hypothetical protein